MLRHHIVLLLAFVTVSLGFSDVGKWALPLNGEQCEFTLAKSLFEDSKVFVGIGCSNVETNITISYRWEQSSCSPDYFHYFEKRIVTCTKPSSDRGNRTVVPYANDERRMLCRGRHWVDISDDAASANLDKKDGTRELPSKFSRPLITVKTEGIYILSIAVQSSTKFNGTVHVEMISGDSYLSAAIYPLLPFFGVMCAVYTILCAAWLSVCALQWRDLLRIQYWIGGVALLGMVESATYYAVYSAIARSGLFNAEAYMFAEWVSVAKRALARMLVIIVSLGFGIVKPRLGPALQRVVGTGALWGLLAAIEAWLRLHHKVPAGDAHSLVIAHTVVVTLGMLAFFIYAHIADDSNRDLLLSEAPMSLLDSAICWWVFVSLAHTMRTLQLRRNTIKLSLYRHFTNTLIFAVISSVVFMLYSIKAFRVLPCITDWKEVWMDEAYWHILFASVLAAIMVLWRPTNNNQRYAFTPLLDNADDEDDEEEEQFVNDAYGVKMRGSGTDEKPEREEPSLDADLRWVEEHIPASTLPLLDSDEENVNTKFEVSKMQ